MSYQAQPIPISINYQRSADGYATALVSVTFPDQTHETLFRPSSSDISGLARAIASVVTTRATALGYHNIRPELVRMNAVPQHDTRKFLKRLGQNGVDTSPLEQMASTSPRIEPTLIPVYAPVSAGYNR